jgi:hypothetical protein
MLAAKPKTKRFLELTQFVLTLVSTCAVLETTRVHTPLNDRPGYQAGAPLRNDAQHDRRLSDLARSGRKRREAEQQTTRRGAALGAALEQQQLRA